MKETRKDKSILGLQYPVIALAPMDGVTDSPMRQITKKYGNPDLIFTEFTHVHGLCVAAQNMLGHFHYQEMERPIVAQIYGHEPEYFYHAAKIVIAMGFDAVDINMGCPATKVSGRGAGAGLIRTPDLARKIIAEVKRGVNDWVADGKLTGLSNKAEKAVEGIVGEYRKRLETRDSRLVEIHTLPNPPSREVNQHLPPRGGIEGGVNFIGRENLINSTRQPIPVTVKTRIGYDEPVTESWIKNITKADPEWISVHGRTLKQLYSGQSNIDELKLAVESTDLPVMINGDISNLEDAYEKIKYTGAFGAMMGRAAEGNPFVFRKNEERGTLPSRQTGKNELNLKTLDTELLTLNPLQTTELDSHGLPVGQTGNLLLAIMLEHARIFNDENKLPDGSDNERAFVQMRKHFGWYTREITKGQKHKNQKEEEEFYKKMKELRVRLMMVRNLGELEAILQSYL